MPAKARIRQKRKNMNHEGHEDIQTNNVTPSERKGSC